MEKKSETIITTDGLFYSNFGSITSFESSSRSDKYLIWLKENYGLNIGKAQPYINGAMPEDSHVIGVYIKDYKKYLSDLNIQNQEYSAKRTRRL